MEKPECQKKTTDLTIYIDFISPWLLLELTTLVVIIYGADVVEWSRALDIRLSDWCCSVSMV
jgi:hypothetical protein